MRRLVLVAALLAGCSGGPSSDAPIPKEEGVANSRYDRWYDPDFKVVCWVSGVYGGRNISCLPESQVVPR